VPSENLLPNKKGFVPDLTIHLIRGALLEVFAVLCDAEFNHAWVFDEMC
jgi:hypothetical protein